MTRQIATGRRRCLQSLASLLAAVAITTLMAAGLGAGGRWQSRVWQTRPRLTTPDNTPLFLDEAPSRKPSVAYHTTVTAPLVPGLTANITGGVDYYDYRFSFLSAFGAVSVPPLKPAPEGLASRPAAARPTRASTSRGRKAARASTSRSGERVGTVVSRTRVPNLSSTATVTYLR